MRITPLEKIDLARAARQFSELREVWEKVCISNGHLELTKIEAERLAVAALTTNRDLAGRLAQATYFNNSNQILITCEGPTYHKDALKKVADVI